MKTPRSFVPRAGFSLIEVTIALGIAAFCLITVFALLPLGINTNQNAFEQTSAAGIASAIAADLHGTPVVSNPNATSSVPGTSGSSVTARFQIAIPPAGTTNVTTGKPPYQQTIYFSQDGSPTMPAGATTPVNAQASSASPASTYRATITFNPEDTTSQNTAEGIGGATTAPRNKLFKVWILITWPALSDPNPLTFPANFSGSYEASTALDCN